MKWAINNGTRMGDIKVPSLRPETDLINIFLEVQRLAPDLF